MHDSPQSLSDWVFPWPAFAIDWRRAGLLVIDIQNYCAHRQMGLGRMLLERRPQVAEYYLARVEQTVIPNVRRLLDAFRQAGRAVIFTRHGALLPDGRDMIARRRQRDVEAERSTDRPAMWAIGSPEHAIVEALAPWPGELVIDKNSSSPFNGTGIDQLLRNMELETLVLVGMATDMCVETTARDAGDRGFQVIVVEDAAATFFPEHHRAALSGIARVYGQVWNTAGVLCDLRGHVDQEGCEA